MEPVELRIFVGGITLETTKEMLMNHFCQFGDITSAEVVYEKKTSKLDYNLLEISKGFGFVSCGDKPTFKKILGEQHSIDGKKIDCNIAFRKRSSNQFGNNENRKVFIGGINNQLKNGNIIYPQI